MKCPECNTSNYQILPGYHNYKMVDKKPVFCQTCIKLRIERLEKLWDKPKESKQS